MSEKYNRHESRSSRRLKEDSTKAKTKKYSYQNMSQHDRHSKTPPLPASNYEINDLLKKRHSLKQELERLEHNKSNDSRNKQSTRERKKRKHSEHKQYSSENSRSYLGKKAKKETKTKERSPDYQDIHIDSEDEENIIEQRRKQRKQLLEKFNGDDSNIKQDNKNNEKRYINQAEKTLQSDTIKKIVKDAKDILITDMFSEKDDFVHKSTAGTITKDENNSQLTDNWDDVDGYYNIISGDVINKRYSLKNILGQGVFANVVQAQDNQTNTQVAIKIVRNNDLMYKTSLKEISILNEINEADPENKYHCVRFITHFMHRGHLCLVLESLHMDLRAVLKKYGKHHGIHMKALISYSRQLFLALRLLKKIGIVHADIKPDNILVNEKKNVLKLCDFGSAAKVDDNDLTPYLVSRFYRAPEIILGIAYSHSIDIWSTACTIYEMATGKIMFTGSSNNKMLKCFMDLKGRISSKLIKKGKFKDQHFNYNNNFLMHKKDEFSGRDKVVEICNTTITRDIYKELQKSCKNLSTGEEKKLVQLKELLDKMLMLDPNQRMSVSDCLRHPFIHEQFEK